MCSIQSISESVVAVSIASIAVSVTVSMSMPIAVAVSMAVVVAALSMTDDFVDMGVARASLIVTVVGSVTGSISLIQNSNKCLSKTSTTV